MEGFGCNVPNCPYCPRGTPRDMRAEIGQWTRT